MPKKFKGENSKAVEARARKDAQKHAEQEKKQRAAEDALWEDDDKHVARKQQRKDEKEKKRVEQLEKKKELQKLHDEEMSTLKSAKPAPVGKLTRADIATQQAAAAAAAEDKDKAEELLHHEKPLEENINRLEEEGEGARSVEEAISLLSIKQEKLEKHPEKRVKAAYTEFEDENLPRLKKENPNLRLSQLKQMLKKEWQKSPSNPLNQRHIAYNTK